MPVIPLAKVAEVARLMGHTDLTVKVTRGGRYVASCSCGYKSTTKPTAAFAARSAAHHLEKIAATWVAAGSPKFNTPNVETFESQASSVA